MTACIGALIHEALSRVGWFESGARRDLMLTAYADHNDDIIAVFDQQGRLVEQHPTAGRVALPPLLFQAATAALAGKRSKSPQPVLLSSDNRVCDVRSRWVTGERVLRSRYLVVHVRMRAAAPMAVVERLKTFRLSPRESQIAGLVFTGQTNQLIADALFISRDTVKTHCKHIFGKLGISRRTEFLRIIGESSGEHRVPDGSSPKSLAP